MQHLHHLQERQRVIREKQCPGQRTFHPKRDSVDRLRESAAAGANGDGDADGFAAVDAKAHDETRERLNAVCESVLLKLMGSVGVLI